MRFLTVLAQFAALLVPVSSQACDSDEMIAQMRSACTEMVLGYQKAAGKPLATNALAKARAHCQALEFDKAGMTLALATQSKPATVTK